MPQLAAVFFTAYSTWAAADAVPHPDDPVKHAEHEALLQFVSDGRATHRHAGGPLPDPQPGTRLVIPAGVTGIVDHDYRGVYEWIRVDGKLLFDPATNTRLRVVTLVITPEGELRIQPQHDRSAVISLAPRGRRDREYDSTDVSGGVICHSSKWHLRGRTKQAWMQPLSIDGNRIVFETAPLAWEVGDKVLVPGVGGNSEQIVEILAAGSTITVSPAVVGNRQLQDGTWPVVGKLTSNVVIRSEVRDDVSQRGHVMIMHVQSGTCTKHVEFDGLGRTRADQVHTKIVLDHEGRYVSGDDNTIGRYPLHFHIRSGANIQTPPHVVEACIVKNSPKHGIVNHGGHVTVTNCVTYDCAASHLFSENGTEIGEFSHNLCVTSRFLDTFRVSGGPREAANDFGHEGHGIWLQSAGVTCRGNHLYGHPRALLGLYMKPVPEHGYKGFLVTNMREGPAKAEAMRRGLDYIPPEGVPYLLEGNTGADSFAGVFVRQSQFQTHLGEWSQIRDSHFENVTHGISVSVR